MSKLTVITGPMFAGKTTWLLKFIDKFESEHVQLFKPSLDDRYSESEVVTHDGHKHEAGVLSLEDFSLVDLVQDGTKLVGIDELNFFDFQVLFPQIKALLARGVEVVGSGLEFDFAKNPFGATPALLARADKLVRLSAVCDGCQESAGHSYRKVSSGSQVLVGAADSYGACCDGCWERFS